MRNIVLMVMVLAALATCGRRQSAHVISGDLEMICGDPDLIGVNLPSINGNGSCGIDNPVQVHFVSGVKLTAQPILNCNTARTLREWVDEAAQPSVSRLRARISDMRVVASYACRTRNSQSGAKLSEHAKGNAIDIAGFTLDNGQVISVLEHWRSTKYGPALRRMYSKACGTFGTTLGPDADRYHQDHMHFDTASYRGGAYCG